MFWSIFINVLEVVSAVATLIFGVYGTMNDTGLKDGKMTPKRKVALYGVLISGAITISIKTTQAVVSYREKEKEAADLIIKNNQLRIENGKEQRYKATVTKKLDSSLGKLGTVVTDGQKSLASLNHIDTVQKSTTKAQQQVLFNTQRALAPLKPITFTVTYIINIASVPSQRKSIKDYYDRMVLLKDSMEHIPNFGRPGFVTPKAGGNTNEIESFTIDVRNSLFPKDGAFFDFLHEAFTIDLIEKEDNAVQLSEIPGLHFRVHPAKVKEVYATDFVNNDIELDVHFSGKIMVRIVSNAITPFGTRNGAEKYYSIIDLADKYVFLRGELFSFAKLHFFSFQGINGAITCLSVTETNRVMAPLSGSCYKRKILKTELMKNECGMDLP